jgi:hypothetical protein
MKTYFLLAICLMGSLLSFVAPAQQGFDRIYSLADDPAKTACIMRGVYPDEQQIIVAGIAIDDTMATNPFSSYMTYIAAIDYTGNMIWKKKLRFSLPEYQRNHVFRFHLLDKVGPDRYVVGAEGWICGSVDSASCLPRPFLYYFNGNGDSLDFVPLPFPEPAHVKFQTAMTVDTQGGVLTTGIYWNKALADSFGIWLAKFDASGSFLWQKTILERPVNFSSASHRVIMSNDQQHYFISGRATFNDSTQTYFGIWKTDLEGNVVLEKHLPRTAYWIVDDIYSGSFEIIPARNGSGYYFIALATMPTQYPNEAPSYRQVYYCGKIDEEANVVWAKTYERDTLFMELNYSLAQQENGDLLFMGYSEGIYLNSAIHAGGSSLICTDSLGNIKWTRITSHYKNNCQPVLNQSLHGIRLTPQGGILRYGGIGRMSPGGPPGCFDSVGAVSWLVLADSIGRSGPNDTQSFTMKVRDAYTLDSIVSISPETISPEFVSVYPVPATSVLNIEWKSAVAARLQLLDITGRVLQLQELRQGKHQLNIQSLPAGAYWLQITNADGLQLLHRQKVIKQY